MIGIIISARCGSKRLENKHFKKINGRYIFDYLLERIENEFKKEIKFGHCEICIATGLKEKNILFEKFKKKNIVNIFYGSEMNIPLRHYQASTKFNYNGLISIDGDDILVSTEAIRALYLALKNGFQYCKTNGLPLGMNAISYSQKFLKKALYRNKTKILETGWDRIFDNSFIKNIIFDKKFDPRIRHIRL